MAIPIESTRVAWEDDEGWRMVLEWDGAHRRPAIRIYNGDMQVWALVPGRRGKRGGWTVYMPNRVGDPLRERLEGSLEVFAEAGYRLWVANPCSGCGAKAWDICVHKASRPPRPIRSFHRERDLPTLVM